MRTEEQLHNFVVEGCAPVIVEGMVAASVCTYCDGTHDLRTAKHRLWATDKIVGLFELHPQWPNVHLELEDRYLTTYKTEAFAEEYLAACFRNEDLRLTTGLIPLPGLPPQAVTA